MRHFIESIGVSSIFLQSRAVNSPCLEGAGWASYPKPRFGNCAPSAPCPDAFPIKAKDYPVKWLLHAVRKALPSKLKILDGYNLVSANNTRMQL